MLKKFYLLIFIFAPSIIGYLHNLLIFIMLSIPIIDFIFFYGFPVLMAYFWFWVGGKFAQSNIKVFASLLLGNSIGIVSLLVYFWQYILIPDSHMNLFLASKSQLFSSTISIFTVRLAFLFEPDKNIIGSVTSRAMQIIGILLMIIIFTVGYYYKKNKLKALQNEKV